MCSVGGSRYVLVARSGIDANETPPFAFYITHFLMKGQQLVDSLAGAAPS